jgi:hypothetical protein
MDPASGDASLIDKDVLLFVLVLAGLALFTLAVLYLAYRYSVGPRRREQRAGLRKIIDEYGQGRGKLVPLGFMADMTAQLTLWGFPALLQTTSDVVGRSLPGGGQRVVEFHLTLDLRGLGRSEPGMDPARLLAWLDHARKAPEGFVGAKLVEWMQKGADGTDEAWTRTFLTEEIQSQVLALRERGPWSGGSWDEGRLLFWDFGNPHREDFPQQMRCCQRVLGLLLRVSFPTASLLHPEALT